MFLFAQIILIIYSRIFVTMTKVKEKETERTIKQKLKDGGKRNREWPDANNELREHQKNKQQKSTQTH